MEEFIAEVLRIVKVVQSIDEPPVLHIVGTFRHKFPPLTHKPQVIVER